MIWFSVDIYVNLAQWHGCFWPNKPEGDCFSSHLKGLKSFSMALQNTEIFIILKV